MSSYKKYSDIIKESDPDEKTNSSVVEIKDAQQKLDLINNNKVVVVDIYGDTCNPCKVIAPTFARLADEYKKYGFAFAKENVTLGINEGIRGVPTFQYFYNGQLLPPNTVGADIPEVKSRLEQIRNGMGM